ncbi:hypothetical protein A6302_04555 [Methylobrevis pamukkalensis]|uniref:Uncharacterized protein n=1 Tax=Methylobrevis pamukkalensis TaxID=1439726 RepID=A0A1E3GMR4_9HYPH|nr:hypothetical protein A6302_04555 [Methylobrevis pamukkalensis]
MVLAAAGKPGKAAEKTGDRPRAGARTDLKAAGRRVGSVERAGRQLRLVTDHGGFGRFLESRLPQLLADYEAALAASAEEKESDV